VSDYSFAAGIQDVDTLDTFDSMTIYGPSGVGKTNLAASAIHAGFDRVLIVDIEGSAKGVGRLNPGVRRIATPTFQHLELVKKELLDNPGGVDFVIFDTMNRAGKLAIRHFQDKPENRSNKFGAWDDLVNWTSDFMWTFHHSHIPTTFIFHALDEKNEQTGAIKTVPKYQGSFKEEVPTVSDIVGYYNYEADGDGKLRRTLYVGEALGLVTKNRFGLPSKIYDPTIANINELIEQAK
jgi:hypothetical protein